MSSSVTQLPNLTVPEVAINELAHASGSGRPGGGTVVAALRPGTGPVPARTIAAIDSSHSSASSPAASLAGSNEFALARRDSGAAPAATLASRRADLLAMPAEGPHLERLTAQFQLEGMAVRAALNNVAADVDALATGQLTREAVADTLTRPQARLAAALTRDQVYGAVNNGATTDVEKPFSHAQLGQAGITGTPAELEAHQLSLTHEAYLAAAATLPAGAERDNVLLAHQAFKVGVAVTENQLEIGQQGAQVAVEMATNKMLLKSQENRRTNLPGLQRTLGDANTALSAHAGASNHILHEEHIADHRRRAIGGNGALSAFNKFSQQVVASGMPQAVSSLIHWGYMRNLGTMAAEAALGDRTGAGPVVASAVIQALVLGSAHKLVSDGPRDLISSVTELGGWARPPEASNAKQLFPDAPTSRLNGEHQAELIPTAERDLLQAQVTANRTAFKNSSPTSSFGNVDGDNVGEAAFAIANGSRDAINSSGREGANSISGKAFTSFSGGLLMSTTHGTAQLNKKVTVNDEAGPLPAYVTPKRQNPRGMVQRLTTGAQKLDLTQQANRLDLYSKVSSAFVGMALAGGLDAVASTPLQAAQHAAHDPRVKGALAFAHALVEGGKSFATLGPFFSGLVAGAEAKTVPGNSGALTKRALIGAHNLFDPTRAETTAAYTSGTLAHKRQVANNVVKGASQLLAQPLALGTEAVVSGSLGVAGSVIGGGVDFAGRGFAAISRHVRGAPVPVPAEEAPVPEDPRERV